MLFCNKFLLKIVMLKPWNNSSLNQSNHKQMNYIPRRYLSNSKNVIILIRVVIFLKVWQEWQEVQMIWIKSRITAQYLIINKIIKNKKEIINLLLFNKHKHLLKITKNNLKMIDLFKVNIIILIHLIYKSLMIALK